MIYEKLEITILTDLKNDNECCLDIIENNKKTILAYLKDTEKLIHVKEFVNKLNEIILNKTKFDLIEKVLRLDLFTGVLEEFRSSDILIKACQNNNIEASSWLLTMNMDKYVQDKNGMTALMHAVHQTALVPIVEKLIEDNDDSIHLTDDNKETALFHAVDNIDAFLKLLRSKIDINHQNNNGETVLIYCCKNEFIEAVNKIIIRKDDKMLSIRDKRDRNAVMYLVENGKYQVIDLLRKYIEGFDVNYRNKNNETLVSILISQFRKLYFSDNFKMEKDKILVYAETLKYLIELGCDFNMPIDDEGNLPLMFFIMIGDYCTVDYMLQYCKNLDLSIKNKNGINATSLSLNIKEKKSHLKKFFTLNKTFDYYYQDEHHYNLLMYYLYNLDSYSFRSACHEIKSSNHEKLFAQVNDKNENIIIMATKLGLCKYLNDDIFLCNNINHQDHLGNTAIYYAVKIKDKYAINTLVYNHADLSIKNKQGVSAYDIPEIEDKGILDIINHPVSPFEFEKKENKKNKKFLFIKKKKDTDEKLEDYIQNYQIQNYKTEYDNILKEKSYTYYPVQDYEMVKGNLWLLYSKQGALKIEYGNDVFNNQQSINNCKIKVRNLVDEYNYYHTHHKEFIRCPF